MKSLLDLDPPLGSLLMIYLVCISVAVLVVALFLLLFVRPEPGDTGVVSSSRVKTIATGDCIVGTDGKTYCFYALQRHDQ